jgi:hypothetical protein
MKKTILIMAIFLCVTFSRAQESSFYLAFQPFDLGLGLRYDLCFDKIGFYSSASYGSYYLYKMNGLRDHVKLTAGIMIPYHKDFYFTAGANYHYVNAVNPSVDVINSRILDRWSFEIGITAVIFKRFRIGLRTDVLRWEPDTDIGLKLK